MQVLSSSKTVLSHLNIIIRPGSLFTYANSGDIDTKTTYFIRGYISYQQKIVLIINEPNCNTTFSHQLQRCQESADTSSVRYDGEI